MNVVLYSARKILLLLISNCFFGILTSSVSVFIDEAERFLIAIRCKRFLKMREYLLIGGKKRYTSVLSDLIACILAACFMLLASFVFNSGNFRLFSIAIFITGFILGKTTVCPILYVITSRIFYCFKWILDVALYPIGLLISLTIKYSINIIRKIINQQRTKLLTRHTAYCFSRIDVDAQYGLLDDYYKELQNERTV